MATTANITVSVQGKRTDTLDLAVLKETLEFLANINLTDGSSTNQINEIWSDTRTLTSGSADNLDLYGGLTNSKGETINFSKVKVIGIKNKSSARILTVGAGTNAFVNWVGSATDTVKVRPGGCFLLVAPDSTAYGVTNTTADVLKITNDSGSSCDYDIVIMGVKA